MSTVWAQVQDELSNTLTNILSFTFSPHPSGIPGMGEQIDGYCDWYVSAIRGTETMQGPDIREHEALLTVRLGHQPAPQSPAPWRDLYQKHIERVSQVQSMLLNKDAYVPSAVSVLLAGDAQLVQHSEKQAAWAWSEVPLLIRWREV